jgi:hypothetical protein
MIFMWDEEKEKLKEFDKQKMSLKQESKDLKRNMVTISYNMGQLGLMYHESCNKEKITLTKKYGIHYSDFDTIFYWVLRKRRIKRIYENC